MRYLFACLAVLVCLIFTSACAPRDVAPDKHGGTRVSSTCDEMQGYPDCQDGVRINPAG